MLHEEKLFSAANRKTVLTIALGFMVAGLLALLFSIQADGKHEIRKALLREFATIAIIGGSLHVVYELFQRQQYMDATEASTTRMMASVEGAQRDILGTLESTRETLVDRLDVAQQANTMGVTRIFTDANDFDFNEILSCVELDIILNDGRTWVSNNAPGLRARFRNPDTVTRLFLTHPDSAMLSVLARKDGSSSESLRAKIEETLRLLREFCVPETKLKVYGHWLFNPHALFISDKFGVATLYFHSRVRRTVPAIRFENKVGPCFFHEVKEDVESLLLDAGEIDWRRAGETEVLPQPVAAEPKRTNA